MNLQLILLGAPGSGKGTQAKRLCQELNFKHLSTGDLLRREIDSRTSIGLKIQSTISTGQLVDDMTVVSLLKQNCDLSQRSYVFDGFPRNLNQANILEREILNSHTHKAIYLDLKFEDLTKRVVYRRICINCGQIYNLIYTPPKVDGICDKCGENKFQHREDDKEDVLRKRYEVFTLSIDPVLDFYEKRNKLARIDASRSPDNIFYEIKKVIS